MPRPKEFTVALTGADRVMLTKVVSSGMHPARMIARARVLLALDETQGPAPDRRVIAERLGVSESTVYRWPAFTAHGGVEDGSHGSELPAGRPKVTGDVEARVIALRAAHRRKGVRGGRCVCWRST